MVSFARLYLHHLLGVHAYHRQLDTGCRSSEGGPELLRRADNRLRTGAAGREELWCRLVSGENYH